MTITQMKYLESVIKHKNITKAAKKSFVSVPAISKLITEIEKQYDVSIFNKKDFSLTPEGELIHHSIQKVLHSYKELESILNSVSSHKKKIKIGIVPFLNCDIFHNFFIYVLQKFDNIEFEIFELIGSEMHEEMSAKEIDFSFFIDRNNKKAESNKHDDFKLLVLREETLCYATNFLSPKHNNAQISIKEIEHFPLLFFKTKDTNLEKYLNYLKTLEIKINPRYYSNEADFLTKISTENIGVLFLKNFFSPNKKLSLLEIKPQINLQISLFYNKNNKNCTDIADYIKDNFNDFVDSQNS